MQTGSDITTAVRYDDVRSHLCAEEQNAMNIVAFGVLSNAEFMSFDDDLQDDPCSSMQCIATDDASGDPSKPNMVIAARSEELNYLKSMHVYDYTLLIECIVWIN